MHTSKTTHSHSGQSRAVATGSGSNAMQRSAVPVVQKAEGSISNLVQLVGQDDVQEYLERIAPRDGPIREYIDAHAANNGGLCAGWVVLHRKNPDKLIGMWQKVSEKIENEDRKGLGRDTDAAVEMYMEAQYHFAKDPENNQFVAPGEEALARAGIMDEPKDTTKKITGKKGVSVKKGEIYETALSVHDGYSGSKKQLFVEIYSSTHTAQIEFKGGHLQSICESEHAGIMQLGDVKQAEKILTAAFFEEDDTDEDSTVKLSFDLHKP